MTVELAGQVSLFDQGTWSGKMCQERSVQTEEKISAPSWKCVCVCVNQTLQYLDLRTENGRVRELSPVILGLSLGESMTLNIGESPRDAVESRLSQILEERPPEKYSLSARACQGILRRAKAKKKQLPQELESVLIRQSVSR